MLEASLEVDEALSDEDELDVVLVAEAVDVILPDILDAEEVALPEDDEIVLDAEPENDEVVLVESDDVLEAEDVCEKPDDVVVAAGAVPVTMV